MSRMPRIRLNIIDPKVLVLLMLSKITLLALCLTFFYKATAAVAVDLNIVTELSPPHQLWEKNHVGGPATDKVKTFIQKTGLTANYDIYPWARAYNKALKEPDTLIYSIAKTPERANLFHWLIPVVEYKFGFVALSSNKSIDLSSIEKISKYVIAVQRNDFAHDWMLSQGFEEGKNFMICADIDCSWNLLLNNNIDLIIDSQQFIDDMLARFNKPKDTVYLVKDLPELSTTGYLAVGKNIAPEKLLKLQAAFNSVTQH
ncbi:MAG: transporter substrate-binding domain-containing protein [Paraglaciecola sp.]|uniref:transporter substrate-binding domain-containing protein n=1 Tax=Paraglaciecola sp. TaxID=1920173 RepID=UPI003299C391